ANAAALELVALVPRADLGGKRLRLHLPDARLAFYARRGALIAGKLGLIEAGLEVAEQRVEGAAFDTNVELFPAGRIVEPLCVVAIDGIVRCRIDRPEQALVLLLFGAVVSRGQQKSPENAALGVEGGPGLITEIAVEHTAALHVVGHALRADRPFGQADQRPRLLARLDPGFELGFAADFAVGESEPCAECAADHRRRQLDQRHPVIPLDDPGSARGAETRQLAGVARGPRADR